MRVALIKKDGLIAFIVEYENVEDCQFIAGEYYSNGDLLAENVQDTVTPIHEIVSKTHWNGSEFKEHTPQTSPMEVWNSAEFKFEVSMENVRLQSSFQINQLASQKILPKYPIYLQLNLPYDFGQDSPEVQEMRTWIDNIRTLANTAKAAIASATTLPEITTIVDNFKTELGNIA